MAPGLPTELPTIPMTRLQEADILQTYMMMFKHMLEDFVHIEDLKILMQSIVVQTVVTGAAPAPDYTIKGGTGIGEPVQWHLTTASARSKNEAYQDAIRVGGAVREGAIDLIKGAVGE